MHPFILLFLVHWVVTSTLSTEDGVANKTKRTITPQLGSYGENRPVLIYPYATAIATASFPHYDQSKQVAAQQILYEYQQTPTNALSNVHVNQYLQPVGAHMVGKADPEPNTGPAQINTATVVTPVQHSSLIRHGQNYAQVQIQPLPIVPHQMQQHQYVPGKYLYVNGKILYQPNQLPNPHTQTINPKPASYVNYNSQLGQKSPVFYRPLQYRAFQPPQSNQLLPITKPTEKTEQSETPAPVKEEETVEENEEGDDENASEEDDGEEESYFEKYHFEDDDDHRHYEHDDDDSERGFSRSITNKQPKKNSKGKRAKSSNYTFGESYSTGSKYEKPSKKMKKGGAKSQYKTKSVKHAHGKPREKFEGKQSQNVPVVHNHKIFREKWYVTKSTE